MFAEFTDLLEADSWLYMIEAKFGLLHCLEMPKMLLAAQQLGASASAWWVTFTATLLGGY
jgi:hypothetical protein